MAKKKYAVHWENEQAVSFEVDGTVYESLDQIPDKKDKQKIIAMLEASSAPDFDEEEWEQAQKESNKAEQIILWVFGGVAALMLLITAISVFVSIGKINNEESAFGVVVEMVVQRTYAQDDRERVVGEAYFPVVRFTASDSRRRDVHLAEGSYPPSYEIGDKVTVRYNPEQPLEARIDDFGSNIGMWILPSITGILGLGFGGAVLAVRWVMSK